MISLLACIDEAGNASPLRSRQQKVTGIEGFVVAKGKTFLKKSASG